MTDVIERLAAATGADLALECEIHDTIDADFPRTPAYTASLDAALALVERKLPGQDICLSRVHDLDGASDGWVASIGPPVSFQAHDGKAVLPSIAICIALMRALKASASQSEHDLAKVQSND